MKSLVVSVCITAVTDMAAVSLLVFFWCSSGVLLGSSGFFWCSSVLHQKERQKNPEEPRRRRTPAPPDRGSLPFEQREVIEFLVA